MIFNYQYQPQFLKSVFGKLSLCRYITENGIQIKEQIIHNLNKPFLKSYLPMITLRLDKFSPVLIDPIGKSSNPSFRVGAVIGWQHLGILNKNAYEVVHSCG